MNMFRRHHLRIVICIKYETHFGTRPSLSDLQGPHRIIFTDCKLRAFCCATENPNKLMTQSCTRSVPKLRIINLPESSSISSTRIFLETWTPFMDRFSIINFTGKSVWDITLRNKQVVPYYRPQYKTIQTAVNNDGPSPIQSSIPFRYARSRCCAAIILLTSF